MPAHVDSGSGLPAIQKSPPFNPEQVVKEFSDILKQYDVRQVAGDRYSGMFVQEMFRKNGISYRVSDLNKSQLYLEALPLINSGRCELLDNPTLIAQFCNLQRKTTNIGRDIVDGVKNSHDDLANAVSGCLALLSRKHEEKIISLISGRELTAADFEWSRLNAPGGYHRHYN